MKICKNCNKLYEDTTLTCWSCGKELEVYEGELKTNSENHVNKVESNSCPSWLLVLGNAAIILFCLFFGLTIPLAIYLVVCFVFYIISLSK